MDRFSHAVVTGGAGFIESHLCDRLIAGGARVTCLDNFMTGSPDNVAHLRSDERFRLDRTDVTDYLHVSGPVDLVLHFASPASPADSLRLPIETMKVGSIGTLHALGLAKDKGARFVLASTSEAYGDPQVHPQPESYWGHGNPVGPRGVYDEAKRVRGATTAYRTTPRHRHRDVRIFNTSAEDASTTAGAIRPSTQVLDGEPLPSPVTVARTPGVCYVSDTGMGIWRLRPAPGGPVNAAVRRSCRFRDRRVHFEATGAAHPSASSSDRSTIRWCGGPTSA